LLAKTFKAPEEALGLAARVEEARILHDPEGLPPATSIAFDRDFSSSALG